MTLVIDEHELRRLPISIDPEVLSGAPVFAGTRVPVDALIANLEAGLTVDAFLDNFRPFLANKPWKSSSSRKRPC